MTMRPLPVDLDYIRIRCRVCEESGCWEWRGHAKKGESPTASFRRPGPDGVVRVFTWRIRHLVYALAKGRVIDGKKVVLQPRCENARCVAPGHLKPVGRGVWNKGQKKSALQGIRISRTKSAQSNLSDADIEQIRAAEKWTQADADRFGISRAYGYMLRKGQFRRHVAGAVANPFVQLLGMAA